MGSLHILIDSVFSSHGGKIHGQGEKSTRTGGLVRVGQKHGMRETVDYYILIKCCDLSQNANFIGGGGRDPVHGWGGRRKKKNVRTALSSDKQDFTKHITRSEMMNLLRATHRVLPFSTDDPIHGSIHNLCLADSKTPKGLFHLSVAFGAPSHIIGPPHLWIIHPIP